MNLVPHLAQPNRTQVDDYLTAIDVPGHARLLQALREHDLTGGYTLLVYFNDVSNTSSGNTPGNMNFNVVGEPFQDPIFLILGVGVAVVCIGGLLYTSAQYDNATAHLNTSVGEWHNGGQQAFEAARDWAQAWDYYRPAFEVGAWLGISLVGLGAIIDVAPGVGNWLLLQGTRFQIGILQTAGATVLARIAQLQAAIGNGAPNMPQERLMSLLNRNQTILVELRQRAASLTWQAQYYINRVNDFFGW